MAQQALSKSLRGSTYNMAASAITLILGFARTVLLMRLLSPAQFGSVDLALFFATFLAPLATFGMDDALVQRRGPRDAGGPWGWGPDLVGETLATHFVLRLGFAVAVLGLGALASPLLRWAYANQVVVVDVLLALLAVNVLEASYATPNAVLRRDMRFGTIALLNLLSSLAMTITAPLLAYLGAGLWSLVAEQAVGPLVRWIVLWVFVRAWRPSLRLNWGEAISLLKFGWHIFTSNILGIFLDRFDDFWVGTSLGPTPLGYYSRAYQVAQYPERVLATPVTNVFFSTYAATQRDKEELAKAFRSSSGFLVRVGLLVSVVLMIVIPQMTLLMFGETWLPIVPVFRLMLVYVVLNPLYVNLSYLVIGAGHPEWLTRVRLSQATFFVVGVVLAARFWGIAGVAVAADLMMLGGVLALGMYSHRLVRFSWADLFGWPAVAAIVAGAVGYASLQGTQGMGVGSKLILNAGLTLLAYIIVVYLAEKELIHEYGVQMLRPLWDRLRGWRMRME